MEIRITPGKRINMVERSDQREEVERLFADQKESKKLTCGCPLLENFHIFQTNPETFKIS